LSEEDREDDFDEEDLEDDEEDDDLDEDPDDLDEDPDDLDTELLLPVTEDPLDDEEGRLCDIVVLLPDDVDDLAGALITLSELRDEDDAAGLFTGAEDEDLFTGPADEDLFTGAGALSRLEVPPEFDLLYSVDPLRSERSLEEYLEEELLE